VEIREYLVLRFDGTTARFPVQDGDVAQARLRAALSQRPEDCLVAVTEDAYIRVRSDSTAELKSLSKARPRRGLVRSGH
jgi:transcriptional antiterminator Rof (Rho-off)